MILHVFDGCELSSLTATSHRWLHTYLLQVPISLATAPNDPPSSWSSNNINIIDPHMMSFDPEDVEKI